MANGNDPGRLTWNVPITNPDGTPTNEFMRKWQAQAAVNATIMTVEDAAAVSALLDSLGMTEGDILVRGASEWTVLPAAAAGELITSAGAGAVPVYSTISAVLDTIHSARGDMLYRGVSGWTYLPANTAGYVLTATGVGSDPAWAPNAGTGSGYAPGAPPTVVQFGSDTTGANSVVLGIAPTNGNLLVAMSFNPTSDTAGAGWTKQAENAGGTDYGIILTKVAGAGESTTQTPCSGLTGTGAIAMWELHGQAAAFFVNGLSQTEQTGQTTNTPILLPNLFNCIGLTAVGLVPAPTILAVYGAGTVDALLNTNSRYLAAGHGNLADTPMCGIVTTFSGSASSKGASCLISS